ncbi:MAG: hypothetical protein ACRDGQ_10060 [Candidatus Limnocylindrales bacterium]
MTRFVDRGAITAAYVGIGMAVTIGVSFLLVIPIEPIYWLLAPLAGLMIGYYANQRSNQTRGAWRRVIVNSLFAGLLTGLTLAVLLLAVKFLFFSADDGYRDASLGGPISCTSGAGCVYQRYLDENKGAELSAVGVTDASSFSRFYWNQQLTTAGLLFGITTVTSLLGGATYALTGPRAGRPTAANQPAA